VTTKSACRRVESIVLRKDSKSAFPHLLYYMKLSQALIVAKNGMTMFICGKSHLSLFSAMTAG